MKIFDKELFTECLRQFRGESSQSEVADKLDTNRSTISLLENGKILPTLEILRRFCNLTDRQIDCFFINQEHNPVVMLMGQLKDSDKPKLDQVIRRINIREKYIAIAKRCGR